MKKLIFLFYSVVFMIIVGCANLDLSGLGNDPSFHPRPPRVLNDGPTRCPSDFEPTPRIEIIDNFFYIPGVPNGSAEFADFNGEANPKSSIVRLHYELSWLFAAKVYYHLDYHGNVRCIRKD